MSLATRPWPESTCSTICGRSTMSRIAWRTRTSLNGAWSTRIVNGCHCPVWEISTLSLAVALHLGDLRRSGRLSIASTWPPSSALTLRGVVGEVDDRDLVDVGPAALPVVGELLEHALLAGGEALVLKRAGADRVLGVVADRDDRVEVLADVVQEGRVGELQRDPHLCVGSSFLTSLDVDVADRRRARPSGPWGRVMRCRRRSRRRR